MAVISEEIGTSVIGGGGSGAGDSFDLGQFLLPAGNIQTPPDETSYTVSSVFPTKADVSGEDVVEASANVVSSENIPRLSDDVQLASSTRLRSAYQAPKSIVSQGSNVNMNGSIGGVPPSVEDLDAVTKVLANGDCAAIEEIMSITSLSREKVIYCIEWLVKEGMIAQDASRYCGLSSVKRMCEQLKGCKACFER